VEGSKQILQEITGAGSYGGRVLSILNLLFRKPSNLIFLEAEPEHSLMQYLGGELGLSLADFDILGRQGYTSMIAKELKGSGVF
jgi:hypothetical protein